MGMDMMIATLNEIKPEAILLGIAIVFVILIILAIWSYCHNPFSLPYLVVHIDISGKKNPDYEDLIDEWIISQDGDKAMSDYKNAIARWVNECNSVIEGALLWKNHKRREFEELKNMVFSKEYQYFKYEFFRAQTRYKQVNYQRYGYTVKNVVGRASVDVYNMELIIRELKKINYETTRKKYESKNQRKLMTQALRDRIIKRDNYTCQKCGKYMPDEVGLHVDHIIPVKKGGKSVESNLQVLCDKCNHRKGIKTDKDNLQSV